MIKFRSYVRVMLRSFVRLTFGIYVIKPCKWDQKITQKLRLEVTSGLRHKNGVKMISESYVRLMLRSYVIKPCKWDQEITYR